MSFHTLRSATIYLAMMTVLTGVIYPLTVTAVGQLLFHNRANGSLVIDGDRFVASELIGQPFDDPKYFWSRPSATSPYPYNAAASSGSNLGPIEPVLIAAFGERADRLRQSDPENHAPIPVDLITASASGLDPHISPAAAAWQISRVARVRGLDAGTVGQLVEKHTEPRMLGLIGEPRVNVVLLNLELDMIAR